MNAADRELAHRELDAMIDLAPVFGTVTLELSFRDGRICRLERGRSESRLVADQEQRAGRVANGARVISHAG